MTKVVEANSPDPCYNLLDHCSESQQVSCEGTGHVVVTFISYSNPTSRRSYGDCCDGNIINVCTSGCDAYFKLNVEDSASRNIGRATTRVIGEKDNYNSINIRKDFAFKSFAVSCYDLRLGTPLCNRPSGIFIFTGFLEKTSLGWPISHWVGLFSGRFFFHTLI